MVTLMVILGVLVLTVHAVICGYIISESIEIFCKRTLSNMGNAMVVVIILSLLVSIVLDALAIYNAITL